MWLALRCSWNKGRVFATARRGGGGGGGGGVGPDGSLRGDERAGSRQTTLSVSGPPSFSSGEKLGVNIVRSVQLPPPPPFPSQLGSQAFDHIPSTEPEFVNV